MWCDDPTRRTLQPGFSQPGDHAAFPDSFPVTVASTASLRQLNDWIVERALELGEEPAEPLPMERFRPNLVVDAEEPFAEDRWEALTVGGVRFRVGKPVGRCVMTTIDAASLTTAKEPIRTLARHRRWDGKTLFARAPGARGLRNALRRRRGRGRGLLTLSPARPAGRGR